MLNSPDINYVMQTARRERTSDSVYQILRDSILTQVFKPGERLNVPDLAKKLDVSITPVKEAITRLTAEGLIAVLPRSGTFVTELTPDYIAETFELRIALECFAAEKAMRKLTAEHIERLREMVADLELPVASEQDRSFHEAKNVEFHRYMVELCGNKRLIEMYNGLNAYINIARVHRSREGWESRVEQEKAEHNQMLRAIESRKPQQLVKALHKHIERAAASLIEDLKTTTPAK